MKNPPISAEFIDVFRAHSDSEGRMTFARFMALALYDPIVGYYRRARMRIGYGGGTDFFTASTSGPVFGELVAAASVALLDGRDPAGVTFVEIGTEPSGGILNGVNHPFGATRTVRIGEQVELKGACVVFSNELFDAQPFHRFSFRDGTWRELGVALRDGNLAETEMPQFSTPPPPIATAPEGYVIDAPIAAAELAEQIAQQPWDGIFIAFDYGKSWADLTQNCPSGTARAYYRHTQSADLLSRPGGQDLTCHVCWDWIGAALARRGFSSPELFSQEAFLVKYAGPAISRMMAAEAARHSQRKLSLMQLLHPAHLGQKFQVLHASRLTDAPPPLRRDEKPPWRP